MASPVHHVDHPRRDVGSLPGRSDAGQWRESGTVPPNQTRGSAGPGTRAGGYSFSHQWWQLLYFNPPNIWKYAFNFGQRLKVGTFMKWDCGDVAEVVNYGFPVTLCVIYHLSIGKHNSASSIWPEVWQGNHGRKSLCCTEQDISTMKRSICIWPNETVNLFKPTSPLLGLDLGLRLEIGFKV